MSRSRKLPIIKDNGTSNHYRQRRAIRRVCRQAVNRIKSLVDYEDYEIPNYRIIVNDYDWCDYVIDFRNLHKLYKRCWIRGSYSSEQEFLQEANRYTRK